MPVRRLKSGHIYNCLANRPHKASRRSRKQALHSPPTVKPEKGLIPRRACSQATYSLLALTSCYLATPLTTEKQPRAELVCAFCFKFGLLPLRHNVNCHLYTVVHNGTNIDSSSRAASSRPIAWTAWYSLNTVASARWAQSSSITWVLCMGRNLKLAT